MASLRRPVFVSNQRALQSMMKQLQGKSDIAIDTESNSLYAYQERVCLIQVSISEADYLIDPLPRSLDLSELNKFFVDPSVQKVFHACEYDVLSLHRDFGFEFVNVFDTMWAARILGWPRVGLASILEKQFKVKLNKRWQRYNWGRRPLPDEALSYARLDSHYLTRLRDLQLRELEAKDRLEEASEIIDEVVHTALEVREEPQRRDGFWRVKGVFDMIPVSRAVLREVHKYREQQARRIDRPPFKVLNEHVLVEIANMRPTRIGQLQDIRGMTDRNIGQHGRNLLRAVARGKKATPPKPPRRGAYNPKVVERYERLREWRKQSAKGRGVESDVIMGNSTLMILARSKVHSEEDLQGIKGIGPWRLKTYGAAIVNMLHDESP